MDYKEWQQKAGSGNAPTKKDISTVANFINGTGMFRTSGTINQNGHSELSQQTDQFVRDINYVYTAAGNAPDTEQNWNDSYSRISQYLNTTLKTGDNFKHLMTAGSAEGNTLFSNEGTNFFEALEAINRNLGMNVDIGWYKTRYSELGPEIAAEDNEIDLDDDFVIEREPDAQENNNTEQNNGPQDINGEGDDDFVVDEGLDDNLNIDQIIAERNNETQQPENTDNVDEADNEGPENRFDPRETDDVQPDYVFVSEADAEEADKDAAEAAALLAEKKEEEAKKQEELRKQEQELKAEAERLAKEAAREKHQRELKRRERPYDVKDNKKYEKSENAYLREMFEDEEKELKAKHKNLAGFKSSGEHSDLIDAYDEFIRSLDTKSEDYSRERKAKCKMALKDAANEYMRMKRERARLNGDHNVDDPDWEPKSKMGKRRYRSAKAIVEKLSKFETDYDRLVMFEDDLIAKRTRFSSSSDDHADLEHSFKALKGYLKYENKAADPELKKKLMDDLRKDAERYLKKIAGPHLNDPKWEPKTEMGKRRFAAAKAVIIRLNQMEGKAPLKNSKKLNNAPTSQPVAPQNNQQPNSSNSDAPGQQPLNNDDMRLDQSEEMLLSKDDYAIRRSNSITPKSWRLDKFKEEFQRKQEKEEEKLTTPFDGIDPADHQMTSKSTGKKRTVRTDGTVEYSGRIITRLSVENLRKKALAAGSPEILAGIFKQACALMLATDGFNKKAVPEDKLTVSVNDLNNNREFNDKVSKMSKEQLIEGIKDPSKAFRRINREILDENYEKMLEDNKQRSASTNDITAQQNLFLNTVAVKHAKALGDHSPDSVERALRTIQDNEDFMRSLNTMTANELKQCIKDPDSGYRVYKSNAVNRKNVVKDGDIENTRAQYAYRAEHDYDKLDRTSAKSCCNAVDYLNKLIGSGQELTKEQQKKAKGYIAALVFDEYIKNDRNNEFHQKHIEGKLKYKDAVRQFANNPEMKEALPEKLDADYLRNFLAGRNGISPKNIRAKLEQNRLRKNSIGQLNAPSQQRRRTRSFNADPANYQLGI